jgi:hypothetical protein
MNGYPDHEVVQLNIDAISAGGGGIHCVTSHRHGFNLQQRPLYLLSNNVKWLF